MADEWYYAKNGQQLGPVSTDVLTRLTASGQVQPNDLVWREGMPNWAPARTVRAIFPEAPPVAVAQVPVAREAGGYALNAEPVDAAPAPRRTRQREYDEPDEGEWDRPRPRRRRGMHPGLLIGGISAAVLVVIGLIVLLVVLLKPGNPRSFSLRTNAKYTCNVEFKAGQKAQIWVTSDQDSDVDLFVYNNAGQRVVFDDGLGKDCYVEFVPMRTESFKIEVWNRLSMPQFAHRNRTNNCTLKWSPP